jgi:predicted Zn-dependent protease with MMP-like domain
MERERFLLLVERALGDLPLEIRNALQNIAVVVEDWPDEVVLAEMGLQSRYEILGLYEGVPLTEREGGGPLLPDRIVLFQQPIENACQGDEEIVAQVRVTVLHEVGHYLGMSEERLDRLGYS